MVKYRAVLRNRRALWTHRRLRIINKGFARSNTFEEEGLQNEADVVEDLVVPKI